MPELVMTIKEIAEVLRLAEKTVYAMATDGELPAFKVRGQWRVRRVDFDQWLLKRARTAGAKRATEAPATPLPNTRPSRQSRLRHVRSKT